MEWRCSTRIQWQSHWRMLPEVCVFVSDTGSLFPHLWCRDELFQADEPHELLRRELSHYMRIVRHCSLE